MNSFRVHGVLFIALLGQLLLGASFEPVAQQNWEKTSYERWSEADVKAVLSASPWHRAIEEEGVIAPAWLGTSAPRAVDGISVLLRSALPVRQALLRQRQLAEKYDAMSATERAAFDAKNKVLLDCPACARHYVVSVKCRQSMCVSGDFIEQYKKYYYLANERGERRELAGITALPEKNGGIVFFFPRLNDKGEPLLTPDSKKLIFNFMFRSLVGGNSTTRKFEFDAATLVRGGEVAF